MKNYYSAICFLSLTLIFTLYSHLHWEDITFSPDKSWVNGEQVNAIEQQYDKFFGLREFAINFWAAIHYTVFNEGNDGVVIGKEQWLFTSEEFDNTAINTKAVNSKLNEIIKIKQQIEHDKGKLIVAVIPSKSRVYEKFLPQPLPEHAQTRYADFISWLEKEHIAHIGLLSALTPQHLENTFLRNDTHWSPFGASVSAQKIAGYLQAFYPQDYAWTQQRFTTEKVKTHPQYQGDLLNFVPVSPYFSFLLPEQPAVNEYVTSDTFDVDLFSDIDYQAVLVGTSYSAKPNWNFLGALQQYTGLDILNMAQEGHGPFKPMIDYLKSSEYKEHKNKLIIWEIPERYLVVATEPTNESMQ